MNRCKRCNQPGYREKRGKYWLCKKHYRFMQMRSSAQVEGKRIPSHEALEKLWSDVGMICPHCNRKMNTLRIDGGSTVVTLQHDRSGQVRLLCMRCNVQHAVCPGDSFYTFDPNMKWCSKCDTTLPLSSFYEDARTLNGRVSHCKRCKLKQGAQWAANNRDKKNASDRRSYHKMKALGVPMEVVEEL